LEIFVKKYVISLLALMSPLAFAQSEIKFDTNVNFFHGLPNDIYLGEASGVAVSPKGRIVVYSRGNSTGPAYAATASQLLEFDSAGKFVKEIGHNLYAWSFAHAIRFDKDDNLYAIDKGSDMIIKFNPEGRPIMVFGRKKEASDEGAEAWKHPRPPLPAINGQFRQPTDVAFDLAGNIFISDGYINSRVAKFDKDGHWVKQWGDRGEKEGEFNTPHSIANDNKGNIYVADRGNRRIQVFDPDGTILRVIHIDVPVPPNAQPWMGATPTPAAGVAQSGAPWAICITPGSGQQYLYSADAFPGRIYKLTLEGKVLGFWGSSGRAPKEFGWIHEMACPSENTVYAAEILNWRVQKMTLHPDASQTLSPAASKATGTK
jgi:hypothetical protein